MSHDTPEVPRPYRFVFETEENAGRFVFAARQALLQIEGNPVVNVRRAVPLDGGTWLVVVEADDCD